MSYLVIGDIHGCLPQLDALLALRDLYAERQLIFLGDYVDIGPESAGVLARLCTIREEGPDPILLQGNHDVALSTYLETGDFVTYAKDGGIPTIRSYTGVAQGDVHAQLLEAIPSDHLGLLASLRPFYETDAYLFSHCGYNVDKPGDRSIQEMVLASHQKLFTGRPTLGKTAICGHYFQSTLRPFVTHDVICLDTGCGVLGGPLTALQLPEMVIAQISRQLEFRTFLGV